MSDLVEMSHDDLVEDFLVHYGVKGMKWGVRRKSKRGPSAMGKKLNDSGFGKLAKANVNRYNKKKAAKVARDKLNPGYAKSDRVKDGLKWGATYTRNVNRNLNKGMDLPTARKTEHKRRTKVAIAVGTAYVAANLVANRRVFANNAQVLLNDATYKKRMQNGAERAAQMMSDSKGIGNYNTVLSEVVSSTSRRR